MSSTLNSEDIPHVTIIRPVKGLEPQLYECLAATFRQSYPSERLEISFCVSSKEDPAYPVLLRLLADFPKFDSRIFIESEDPNLSGQGNLTNLGPNPKIRNMSRAYREAKGDVIWILDCNVWIGKGVAGRMVDKLFGYQASGSFARRYKIVHQLPLVVDSVGESTGEEGRGLLEGEEISSTNSASTQITTVPKDESLFAKCLRTGGGRLDEMFMACSHAKFYTAINTVSIAPCMVGKSSMFRKSHLDELTSGISPYSPGIDHFSENICEDHLIGDLLWRKKVEAEKSGHKFSKHGLVFGDLAIQPMAGMSVSEYFDRRVRWLRARKYTVLVATLVEPGVEPFLCSFFGAFAITTVPWVHRATGIAQTWPALAFTWFGLVMLWMLADRIVYNKIHSGASFELDADTPSFARPLRGYSRRSVVQWVAAWLGREMLALPIWLCAWAGNNIRWRGREYEVCFDGRVRDLGSKESKPKISTASTTDTDNASARKKARDD